MTRNLKTLGLAVVAVLAMTAIVASAAQAATYTAASYPTKVKAVQTEANRFTAAGTGIECTTATFEGSEFIKAAASTLTINPTYSGCKDEVFGLSSTVTMNGCDYVFNTPTGSVDTYTSTVNLVCPAGKNVEVHASTCTITIFPKNNMGTVTYTNQTAASPPDVVADIAVTGVEYEIHKGFLCPFGENTVKKTDGKYEGKATVTGINEAGKQVGVDVG